MAVFNEPAQWDHTLGNNADASTLPDDSAATAGTASLQKLFQLINATPLEAGGIAPDREDVNALFKYLGDQIFYTQNGGIPSYNAAYDYIPGRVVSYNDNIYKCIQANGVSSTVVAPDSGTEYWQRLDNFVRSVNGVGADAEGNVSVMPDFTTVTQIYAPYTASSDGWLFIDFKSTANGVSVLINGTYVFLHDIYNYPNPSEGVQASGFIPVSKGDVITVALLNSTINLFFMRCKGAN